MATLEERVQALEQEIAARKHAEEMLIIAVRALASKQAEMRESRADISDLKSIAQQILARLPEEPLSR